MHAWQRSFAAATAALAHQRSAHGSISARTGKSKAGPRDGMGIIRVGQRNEIDVEKAVCQTSVMRPSCVRHAWRVAGGDGRMAWMFTLSLVVVAGPTQPPPSRIGPVSPLIHSVSNPPAVDKGVGSIGRWGWAGTIFSGGALHIVESSHAGVFVCWHFLWTRFVGV